MSHLIELVQHYGLALVFVNVLALLAHLVRDGRPVLDPADEITAGILVTADGKVVHPALLEGDRA